MIPRDYRLEHVALGLVERLEASRRSFPDDPDALRVEVDRVVREHASAAVAGLAADAFEDPSSQARLLERELPATFAPRYARLAGGIGRQERTGYGLGGAADPLGRILTFAGMLLGQAMLIRFSPTLWAVPIGVLLVVLVLVPDLLRVVQQRRHQAELQALVDDMAKIQANARTLAAPLPMEAPSAAARRPATREEA